MSYILAIDQSTQGTKALLLDAHGRIAGSAQRPHRQIISAEGWISHDPEEIYQNVLACCADVLNKTGIEAREIAALSLTNQRETTLAWDQETGAPAAPAVVWQCARAQGIADALLQTGAGRLVQEKTGLPVSPYFPAEKMAWLLQSEPEVQRLNRSGRLCLGTVDSFLLHRLTGRFATDVTNAARTQLMPLRRFAWDAELTALFGIPEPALPEILPCDARFGETDLGGLLPGKIPVHAVLGDSHAALFAQGCREAGQVKATYGTGSSVMLCTGAEPAPAADGLAATVAWCAGGTARYALEGNLSYAGAVVTWLQEIGLLESAADSSPLAQRANPEDTTILVPAFSGLGAPYWRPEIRAAFTGMSRLTGRAELVRAGLDAIAFQVTDVLQRMQKALGAPLRELRTDGGAARNPYLMQRQSDLAGIPVTSAAATELSALGVGTMAGIAAGLYPEHFTPAQNGARYMPAISRETRAALLRRWNSAVRTLLDAPGV